MDRDHPVAGQPAIRADDAEAAVGVPGKTAAERADPKRTGAIGPECADLIAAQAISRALTSVVFPARITLVAALNPCPCGYRGDTIRTCTCSPVQADRYWNKLSGPLLDRIDLQVE